MMKVFLLTSALICGQVSPQSAVSQGGAQARFLPPQNSATIEGSQVGRPMSASAIPGPAVGAPVNAAPVKASEANQSQIVVVSQTETIVPVQQGGIIRTSGACPSGGCGTPACGTSCNTCTSCDSCGCGGGHFGGIFASIFGPCPPKCEPEPEPEPECECNKAWRLCPNDYCGWEVTGLIYGTGVYNLNNAGSRYNGPMTMNDQEGVYLNQLWFDVIKGLKDDEVGWGAGVTAFFGNDYIASLSRGFENADARGWLPKWWDNQDYGIAIPQAYVEFGTTKFNVKAGHFWTPHGYMVVRANGNFFNTLPYGFMMTNPFTHWGVMGNAQLNDRISVLGAVVNGWDALSRPNNSAGYIVGMKYNFCNEKGWFSTTIFSGQEPENLGTGYAARTLITNILDYNVSDNVEFVLENNLLWQKNRGQSTDFCYSVIPYLFYKINDCLKAGVRYEVFYDPTGFLATERVGNGNNGPVISNGVYHGFMHSFTAGLNWAPNGSKNLMIRPEVRYDMFAGDGLQPFSLGNSDHQIVTMLGAYYTF